MALNSHYSNRLKNAVDTIFQDAAKKFYDIFTSNDFYDIADKSNGLTPEQRDQVPTEEQKRFTQFSNALSQMMQHILGNPDNGLLSVTVQTIIDQLDARASMTAGSVQTLGTALAVIPPTASVKGGMEATESSIGGMMGISPYHPDMIPPLSIGMPALPALPALSFKFGFFQPNYNFLYDHELHKSHVIYQKSNFLYIGPGIKLTGQSEQLLKKVFSVAGADTKGNPVGDNVGGITSEDFQKILSASKTSDFNSAIKNSPSLTEVQMRSCFNRYVQATVWDVLTNPHSWAYGHWGAIAHNSCPEPVKTAVLSFMWTEGLSLVPKKNDVAALVSYLTTVGVMYLIGYSHPYRLTPIGIDMDSSGSLIEQSNNYVDIAGFATDKKIANTYFTLVADIISRYTSLGVDPGVGNKMRERRMAEAQLIYSYVGFPMPDTRKSGDPISLYGADLNILGPQYQEQALIARKFDVITSPNFKFYRYGNQNPPGGQGPGGSLGSPEQVTANISFSASARKDVVPDSILTYLKSLMDRAGVKSATITSTARTPEDQARAMYNNLSMVGNTIHYGAAGTAVVDSFYTATNSGKSPQQVQQAMIDTIKQSPPARISRHCADFNEFIVIDISPKSIFPANRAGMLESVLRTEKAKGSFINQVLSPAQGDPALHVEIKRAGFEYKTYANDALPENEFTINSPIYNTRSAWRAPISNDLVYAANNTNGSPGIN
jgi:hypothetical protein